MKLEIIKQEKNPFLQREELTIEITSESAPSASEVMSELGKDEALTVIKKINTNFGRQTFLTEIVVYDNLEAKEKIETIPQKIRKKMATEKKTADEAAKKKAAEESEAVKKAEEEAKAAAEKGSAPTNNEDESVRVPVEEVKEEPKEEVKEEEKKA